MNEQLAQAAINGITDPATERKPGFCCRWVRQVVQKTYPGIYDGLFAGSAADTGENFLHAGLGQVYNANTPIEVGDILCKTNAGPFGHIGIACRHAPWNEIAVAENSSTKTGRVLGAKGYRGLSIWGKPAIIIRLPSTAPVKPAGYLLNLNTVPVGSMPLVDGTSMAPVRRLVEMLGLSLDLDETTRHVVIDGHDTGMPVTIIGSVGYLPLRPLAAFLGLTVAVDEATRTVTISRP